MKLPDLIRELQNSLYNHPLTYTNVERVTFEGCDVVLEFDQSETEAELEESKETITRIEEENESLTKQISELKQPHADLKDPDSGVTLEGFKKEAAYSDRMANLYKQGLEMARAELTAL